MKTLRDSCVIFGSTLATFTAITLIMYHASAWDVQFRKRHLQRRKNKMTRLRDKNGPSSSSHKVSKTGAIEEIIPPLAELGLVAYYEEGELERVATKLIIRELAVNPVALQRLSLMLSSDKIEDREFATDFLLFYLLRVSQGRADLSSYPIMYGLVLGFDKCLDTFKELKDTKSKDKVAFSRTLALFINYISILTQLCEDARHLHPAHQLCLYGFVDLCYKWNEIAPFSDRDWKPGRIPNIRDVQNKTSRFPYTYHVLQDVIIADYQMESTIEGLVEKLGGSGDDYPRSEEQLSATREFLNQFYESRMDEMPQFENPTDSLNAARDFLVFFYDNYYDSVRRAEREIQNGTESDDTDDERGPSERAPRPRTIANVPMPSAMAPDDEYTSEEDTCSEHEMLRAPNNPELYVGECVDDEDLPAITRDCECDTRHQDIFPVGLPPDDGEYVNPYSERDWYDDDEMGDWADEVYDDDWEDDDDDDDDEYAEDDDYDDEDYEDYDYRMELLAEFPRLAAAAAAAAEARAASGAVPRVSAGAAPATPAAGTGPRVFDARGLFGGGDEPRAATGSTSGAAPGPRAATGTTSGAAPGPRAATGTTSGAAPGPRAATGTTPAATPAASTGPRVFDARGIFGGPPGGGNEPRAGAGAAPRPAPGPRAATGTTPAAGSTPAATPAASTGPRVFDARGIFGGPPGGGDAPRAGAGPTPGPTPGPTSGAGTGPRVYDARGMFDNFYGPGPPVGPNGEDIFSREFIESLEVPSFNPFSFMTHVRDPNRQGGTVTLNPETGNFDLTPQALDIINELRATGVLPPYGSPGRTDEGPAPGAGSAPGARPGQRTARRPNGGR
ncbi:hypothetical protein CKK34_6567 [Yarrowia sp. E02]|nr:hypothetical protein CKK34_6567 [Yarrowia sp. E02]